MRQPTGPTTAKLLARLKWEVACERLAFALDRDPAIPPDTALDLDAAFRLVRAALEEVREACQDDMKGAR